MFILDVLHKENAQEIHKVKLGNHEFIVECDIEGIKSGIEELRTKYNDAQYGYIEYMGEDLENNLTFEQYQKNLDEFYKEFEMRLEPKHIEKVIENAVKKKNGTFAKGRVYDEVVLKNATWYKGRGDSFTIYELRYKILDDKKANLGLTYSNRMKSTDY